MRGSRLTRRGSRNETKNSASISRIRAPPAIPTSTCMPELPPARAEAAGAAHRLVQRGDLHQLGRLVAHEQELRDPVTRDDLERLVGIGVEQQHAHLAAVA